MNSIERLDDRYRLLRVIGSGSEGMVHLALQESTQRFLAVKEIPKGGVCYNREGVEVWKRLHHAHLPEVLDLIETEETIWVVMEYVEGINLRRWVQENGYPHTALLLQWLLAICDTLEYLHGQDPPVIFGDLKPENIMIQKRSPVLVDLGSVYIKGSKTKKTGTYLSDKEMTLDDRKKDICCFGKTMETVCPDKRGVPGTFIRRAKGMGRGAFFTIGDCKKYLKRILFMQVICWLLLGISLFALFLGMHSIVQNRTKTAQDTACQEWEDMLDAMLQDLIFTEEEYCSFLNEWKKVEENQKIPLNRYGDLCYKVGLACWYFTEDWDGSRNSQRWFMKVAELPEELQRNSTTYLTLQKWKDQMGMAANTGEVTDLFGSYYEELKKIEPCEEEYFQVAFYKEELLFFIHYMAELKMEGICQEEVEQLRKRGEALLYEGVDQRKVIIDMKEEIQSLLIILDETEEHIYGKDEM